MKTILRNERPLSMAEHLAFEIFKAISSNNAVMSFILTPNELLDLQASIDVTQYTEADLQYIQNGTAYMGVPIHVVKSDYIDEREAQGFVAASRVKDKLKYN